MFSRFVIAGAANTGLTYLLYLGLAREMPYMWAYSITYIVGICVGYLLTSFWVFQKSFSCRTALGYPLTYIANYILGLALLYVLVEWLNVPKKIAPLGVVAISVPVMYVLTRSLFFGQLSGHAKTDN